MEYSLGVCRGAFTGMLCSREDGGEGYNLVVGDVSSQPDTNPNGAGRGKRRN